MFLKKIKNKFHPVGHIDDDTVSVYIEWLKLKVNKYI